MEDRSKIKQSCYTDFCCNHLTPEMPGLIGCNFFLACLSLEFSFTFNKIEFNSLVVNWLNSKKIVYTFTY